MIFQGKIKSVNTYEIMSDTVTLDGTIGDRPCTINVQCHDIAELMIGSYGLNKETVQVQIGGEEDL